LTHTRLCLHQNNNTKCRAEYILKNNWSKQFDKRPHRSRRRTVQSYSPGGASVPCHVDTLAPPGNTIKLASFGPPESTTQTAIRSVQPFLHRARQKVPILYMYSCLLLNAGLSNSFIHSFIWFEQYSSGHKGYKNTNICPRTKYKTST